MNGAPRRPATYSELGQADSVRNDRRGLASGNSPFSSRQSVGTCRVAVWTRGRGLGLGAHEQREKGVQTRSAKTAAIPHRYMLQSRPWTHILCFHSGAKSGGGGAARTNRKGTAAVGW